MIYLGAFDARPGARRWNGTCDPCLQNGHPFPLVRLLPSKEDPDTFRGACSRCGEEYIVRRTRTVEVASVAMVDASAPDGSWISVRVSPTAGAAIRPRDVARFLRLAEYGMGCAALPVADLAARTWRILGVRPDRPSGAYIVEAVPIDDPPTTSTVLRLDKCPQT